MTNILFIFTSTDKLLTGGQTGYWLAEAAHPYYVLSPHAQIDFAAPKGPNPPLDEGSVQASLEDEVCTRFLNDEVVKSKMATAVALSEIDPSKYDILFYPGGHGPMFDLPTDPISIEIATKMYNDGKIVAAVCHGPAALTNVKDANGKYILDGRNSTGFSNVEETQAQKVDAIPFLLEDRMVERGAKYVIADEPWAVKVVVDGNVYTGQNPASAGPLAEEILKALKK